MIELSYYEADVLRGFVGELLDKNDLDLNVLEVLERVYERLLDV
jgi:hypothetical protein